MTSASGPRDALVVLGGADGALTTLAAARRLGLATICVDMRAEAPAARVADEFLHLSTADVDGIVDALRARTGVVGVISPASDVNIPYQREIARRLGLPCPLTDGAVRVSTDKGYFHEVCDRLGIATPRSVAGSAETVLARAADLHWPVVVKPVDLGGGRGIVRCTEPEELAAAVRAAEEWSPTDRVIVEEFIEGRDCGSELFLLDGEVIMGAVSQRVAAEEGMVTLGHSMAPDDEVLAELTGLVGRICAELGYRDGPANVDLIVDPSGRPVLIEMGTRLGGNGIGELLGLVYGVDNTELAISVVLPGPMPRPELLPAGQRRHAAARCFFADRVGVLRRLEGLDRARRHPAVVDVLVTARPGDPVEPAHQCRSKAGFALLVADGPEQLVSAVEEALSSIEIRLEPEPAGLSATVSPAVTLTRLPDASGPPDGSGLPDPATAGGEPGGAELSRTH